MTKTSPSLQRIFDQGHAVGGLARERFPGGVLITADHRHIKEALEETRMALDSGATTIYEAAFVAADTLVRPDILIAGKRGSWNLYEVKSSGEVKDVYVQDAAVQRHVLEESGLNVAAVCIVYINNRYLRKGPLDLAKLFTIADVSEETRHLKHEIKAKLAELAEIAKSTTPPSTAIGPWCKAQHKCGFYEHCWKDIQDTSIHHIKHLSWDKIGQLQERGISEISAIPEDFPLSPQQALQRLAEKDHRTLVNKSEIQKHIKRLKYPLHYLDFETISPAIPPFDDCRPMEQLPFQASLHIQDTPGSSLRHLEYLGSATEDPRPRLVDFLVKNIASSGSVIAYSKDFEGMCLKVLAEHFPSASTPLLSIKQRLWDSAESFSRAHYVHPGFKGRWSIKKVLPVLVPDMTYAGLAVANGEDAQAAYLQLMSGKLDPEEAERLKANLKEYCGQDTLAMVRLVEILSRAVEEGS
ncbi:MAG: DUF2779 domain-containing protein [Elusimicrobiota bacterium]|jgi:hypothetical protein